MPKTAARKKSKKKPLKLVNRKFKKKAHYMVSVLVMFVGASILVFSGVVYKRLNTVFVSAQGEDSQHIQQQDIVTLLLASSDDIQAENPLIKNLELIVLDKKDSEITLIKLDANKEYEVQGKFGKEKGTNLMALAKSANSASNEAEQFFVKTLENNLKFNIDRYIYVNNSQHAKVQSLFQNPGSTQFALLVKDLAISNLGHKLRTDVTDRELYPLLDFLSQNPVITQKPIGNYSPAIKNIVINSNVADEKFMIAILNGAKISGAGTYSATVVEQAGGRVTFVGNAKNAYKASILVTDNPDSHSVKYLKSFFKIDKVESKSKYSLIESDVERADVTLILGLDFESNIY